MGASLPIGACVFAPCHARPPCFGYRLSTESAEPHSIALARITANRRLRLTVIIGDSGLDAEAASIRPAVVTSMTVLCIKPANTKLWPSLRQDSDSQDLSEPPVHPHSEAQNLAVGTSFAFPFFIIHLRQQRRFRRLRSHAHRQFCLSFREHVGSCFINPPARPLAMKSQNIDSSRHAKVSRSKSVGSKRNQIQTSFGTE